MNPTSAAKLGYAFDLRQLHTGVVFGVGLAVPSQRYLSFLTEGSVSPLCPELSADTWSEIDAWVADGDTRLPERPAPMPSHTVAAMTGAGAASAIGVRFAAMPLGAASRGEVVSLVEKVLPQLLRARLAAA